MKRIILVTVILFASIAGMASNGRDNDSIRYLASTLRQNWFVTASGSINWYQGSDRIPAGNFTTLNGPTFGGGVSVGKWITHNLGLRLSYDINRGHSFINGGHDNLTYLQYLYVDKNNPIEVTQDGKTYKYYETSFRYHYLHGDVMLSPVDLFLGYYSDRIYTPVIVAGFGVACVSEHVFVAPSLFNGEGWNFERGANVGLLNNFKLNKNFDLTLTTMLSAARWNIDTKGYEYGGAAEPGVADRPRRVDFDYTIALGITWNSSGSDEYGNRIYELPNNYENEMRDMRKRIKDLEKELDECLRNQPTTTVTDTVYINSIDTVQEIVSYPFSIFFNLDSYQLMSKRDLVNLREIARVSMEKGWKIRLRGSCDSATATPEYNQRLSENRCNKIKLELMDMGVPESQIQLVPVGGVHELDPTEFDRRVLIELVKEIK